MKNRCYAICFMIATLLACCQSGEFKLGVGEKIRIAVASKFGYEKVSAAYNSSGAVFLVIWDSNENNVIAELREAKAQELAEYIKEIGPKNTDKISVDFAETIINGASVRASRSRGSYYYRINGGKLTLKRAIPEGYGIF